jgi:hypothetical protein
MIRRSCNEQDEQERHAAVQADAAVHAQGDWAHGPATMKFLRSVTSTVARQFLILALAMLSLASGAARADAQGRDIVQLNRAWTFTLGDPAGAGAGGDVGKDWEKINLPHSFSMPYFLGSGFYVGYGWYPQGHPGR